jgi:hypothetical protein
MDVMTPRTQLLCLCYECRDTDAVSAGIELPVLHIATTAALSAYRDFSLYPITASLSTAASLSNLPQPRSIICR